MTGKFHLSPGGRRRRFVNVALPLPLFNTYTYHIESDATLEEGQRVVVPLRGRQVTGYIVGFSENYKGRTASVVRLLGAGSLFPPPLLASLRWAADYYHHPLGEVLKSSHPPLEESFQKQRFYLNITERDELVEPYRGLVSRMKSGKGYLLSTLRRWGLSPLQIRKGVEVGILSERRVTEKHGPDGTVRAVTEVNHDPTEDDLKWLARSPTRESLYHELKEAILPLETEGLTRRYKNAGTYLRDYAKRSLITVGAVAPSTSAIDWKMVDTQAPPITLSSDQQRVLAALSSKGEEFGVYLLHGITGSGKTEVYIRRIEQVLAAGKRAVVVVPEIALTPQLSARFRGRFGDSVSILHSGLSALERAMEWRRVESGMVPIVVGARSAIFAPVRDLGLIVVDEEHDSSYKQEEGFRYHARDFAIVRAKHEGCPIILGSATPSLESRWNAETGKYVHLVMSERPTPRPLPRIEIVDLRTYMQEDLFTSRLVMAIRETLLGDGQVILFLNRRGFEGRLQCDACGEVLSCPNCSVSLTHHLKQGRALCHYCGFSTRSTSSCPSCATPLCGSRMGTEKIMEKLAELFPQARLERMDRDTVRFGGVETILNRMRDGEIDILLGTQMVTKGHDFPGVTLVGVLDADHSLWFQDFRAAERTFQLLVQVAGRAGRGDREGRVIVQTRNPTHHAIQSASRHNYELFYEQESFLRRELNYPPFGFLALIRMSGEDGSEVMQQIDELAQSFAKRISPEIEILGPVESPISMIRGKIRWQIMLKSTSRAILSTFLYRSLDHIFARRSPSIRVSLDLDPQSML